MEFDFNKNQVVDSIEKVPQDFRGLYVEDEGKFKLDTSDDFKKSTVSVVTGLNRSLNAARLETKNAKEGRVDLSSLSDYGETVDEILEGVNSRIEEVRKAGKGGKGSEDVAKAVKSAQDAMAQAHKTQLTGMTEENKALTGQLYGQMVVNQAESALNAAGAVNSKLLMPFIKEMVGVTKEDGKFKIFVKNETGDVRYSGTTGDPMSIKELVAEFKGDETYGPMFKSETPRGGGKKPSLTTVPKKGEGELTANQKIASALEKRRAAAGG